MENEVKNLENEEVEKVSGGVKGEVGGKVGAELGVSNTVVPGKHICKGCGKPYNRELYSKGASQFDDYCLDCKLARKLARPKNK